MSAQGPPLPGTDPSASQARCACAASGSDCAGAGDQSLHRGGIQTDAVPGGCDPDGLGVQGRPVRVPSTGQHLALLHHGQPGREHRGETNGEQRPQRQGRRGGGHEIWTVSRPCCGSGVVAGGGAGTNWAICRQVCARTTIGAAQPCQPYLRAVTEENGDERPDRPHGADRGNGTAQTSPAQTSPVQSRASTVAKNVFYPAAGIIVVFVLAALIVDSTPSGASSRRSGTSSTPTQ